MKNILEKLKKLSISDPTDPIEKSKISVCLADGYHHHQIRDEDSDMDLDIDQNLNDESEKLFIEDLKKFVVHASSKIIMVYLQSSIINVDKDAIQTTLRYMTKRYLNQCWHNYWTKNDQYVVDSYNKIISHNIVRGVVCLTHWCDRLCCSLFVVFDLNEEVNTIRSAIHGGYRDLIKELIEDSLKDIYDFMIQKYKNIRCNGICYDEYNLKDIFIFEHSFNNNI